MPGAQYVVAYLMFLMLKWYAGSWDYQVKVDVSQYHTAWDTETSDRGHSERGQT